MKSLKILEILANDLQCTCDVPAKMCIERDARGW